MFKLFLLVTINLIVFKGLTQSVEDKLIHNTVKINCSEIPCNKISTGTGFFLSYDIHGKNVRCLVTNRHVIEKCHTINISLTKSNRTNGPDFGNIHHIQLNSSVISKIIYHPDKSIDLAIIPLDSVIQKEEVENNIKLYIPSFQENYIATDSIFNSFKAIEEVLMIGYPKGLIDDVNNTPVVRVGITATPMYLDYQGKSIFLIDIPIYKGSSGSPIIFYKRAVYTNNGITSIGNKHIKNYLLGVTFASSNIVDFREIYKLDSVNNQLEELDSVKLYSKEYINIANIIKASRLLDFKPILQKEYGIH